MRFMESKAICITGPPTPISKGRQRGMTCAESTGVTARFQKSEIDKINKYCEDNNLVRSIFIHDLVMEKVGLAKR